MHIHAQRSLGGNRRVFLPQRARRRITRVRKRVLALSHNLFVQRFKIGGRDEHFSAYLDLLGVVLPGKPLRDGGDGSHIVRHVLARGAVPASCCTY